MNEPSMYDQDIQRFMHIRDEIQEEIKKIGPQVISLQEATRSLLSQVDVFKVLSERAQEEMKRTLKEASAEMAQSVSQELSSTIESQIQEILTPLDQSAQYARRSLDIATKTNPVKRVLILFAAGLICGVMGAGMGYIYAKRNLYALPPDFIKMYAAGLEYKETLSKKAPNEQQKTEKRRAKK